MIEHLGSACQPPRKQLCGESQKVTNRPSFNAYVTQQVRYVGYALGGV
jgi:hypothetical protein